jgi:uridylate kinase
MQLGALRFSVSPRSSSVPEVADAPDPAGSPELKATTAPRWGRVVLKLSGEALASAASDETIDAATVSRLAREIASARAEFGVEMAVVVGGGNIWRGTTGAGDGMDRATSDTMGMLATVINALALQDAIEREGQPTRVLSAIQMAEVCEPYIRRRAIRHLEKGRVVILAAGMGSPYFTTDTPAALRAAEIEADGIMKGTHSGVDGVYTADPRHHPDAVRYDEIGYMEVVSKDLRVMDMTAITFCRDNAIPILVFDIMRPGNIRAALAGERIGTLIQ